MQESAVFDWNLDYLSGRTPWELGQPAPELVRAVEAGLVAPGSAFELGCGSGQNAMFLARQGFSVTAADCSTIALARARRLTKKAYVNVRFLETDLCRFTEAIEPVDFVFDRSCYEYLRESESDREGYLRTLLCITRVGSKFLLIARRSRKKRGEALDVARILTDLGKVFSLDEVGTAKLRSADEESIRWAFLMTRHRSS